MTNTMLGSGEASDITFSGSLNLSASHPSGSDSRITINPANIVVKPPLGLFYIDTLASGAGTKALKYNPSTGAVTSSDTLAVSGVYAPLASPTFTGTVTIPTLSLSTTVSGAGTWTAGAINTASNVTANLGLFGAGVRAGNNTNIYWNSGPVILGNTNDITLKNAASTAGANVSIGTSAAVKSAILDVNSTTKGALLPRMTGAEAEAISSPATGLIIYCTNGNGSVITSVGLWNYNGSAWVTAGAKSYKVLIGNLTQTSTSAPSLTIFENTTGTTFTMGRSTDGTYTLTAGAAVFTSNKTQVLIHPNVASATLSPYVIQTSINSTSIIDITSWDVFATVADDILNNTPIEIRIYP